MSSPLATLGRFFQVHSHACSKSPSRYIPLDPLSKNPKLENIEGENLRNLLYLQERDAAILTLTAG